MKLTIDTTLKQIYLDEPVTLEELKDFLKDKFPKDYKEFKISGHLNNLYYPYYHTPFAHMDSTTTSSSFEMPDDQNERQ